MPAHDSDSQLGQRFSELLQTRRPVSLPTAMGLLVDLMGAEASLLPSLRMLASQPIFLQFINASPDALLLPLRESLLAAAQDTLAPPLVLRILRFLDGYMGLDPSVSELPRSSSDLSLATSPPGFPQVLRSRGDDFPATVVALDASALSGVAIDPPTAFSSSTPALQGHSLAHHAQAQGGPAAVPGLSGLMASIGRIPSAFLIPVVVVAGLFSIFKIPAVCKAFDLCSSASEPSKRPVKKAASSAVKPRVTSAPAPVTSAPRVRTIVPDPAPAPRYTPPQSPPARPRYEPPAPRYEPRVSEEPPISAPPREETPW